MKKKIIWLFYLLFAICFTFTAINIILHNTYYKALHLICVTTICLVGLTIIYKNLSKNEKFIEKNYNKILISFGIGMFIIEIVLGIALRYDPLWDVGAIHKGAIEWVETGTFENYYEYFYRFPNNLAAMAFLHLFFKIASIFGIKDYFAVSVVINSIMVSCTTVIVSLICKKIDDYLPYINLSGRMYETHLNELCAQPYVARYQFTAFQVLIDYEGSAFFKKGENRKFKVKVINSNTMREQQWVKIKLYLPDGVTAVGVSEVEMPLNNLYLSCAEKEFELNTESFMSGRLELIVDVSLNGRHSSGPVKMVLLGQ